MLSSVNLMTILIQNQDMNKLYTVLAISSHSMPKIASNIIILKLIAFLTKLQ